MKPVWPDEFTPKVMADLKKMFGRGLTFGDNIDCAIVTVDAKHNTETPFANPLRQKPLAFLPIDSMSITVAGGVGSGVARPLVGDPQMNLSRTDGMLGITVQIAPPVGACHALRSSSALSIPYAANTAVTWDTATQSGGLSWAVGAPTKIVCAYAGVVSAGYSLLYDTAAGGYREGKIYRNGSDPNYAYTVIPGGTYAGPSSTDEIVVAAGDYLETITYQNQTAAAALNLTASSNLLRMTARYVAPPTDQLVRIRGILVGA